MRTAWISSVIFSFVAVIGVGGFSFFLISNKADDDQQPMELNLADNQVFATAILPRSEVRPIRRQDTGDAAASSDEPVSSADFDNVFDIIDTGNEQSSTIDQTSDSKATGDSVSDSSQAELANSTLSEAENTEKATTGQAETPAKNRRLSKRDSASTSTADDDERTRRILYTADSDYELGSDTETTVAADKTAPDSTTASLPEELDPESTTVADIVAPDKDVAESVVAKKSAAGSSERKTDLPARRSPKTGNRRFRADDSGAGDDDLVALNRFNSQTRVRAVKMPKGSFDNLLTPEVEFDDSVQSLNAGVNDDVPNSAESDPKRGKAERKKDSGENKVAIADIKNSLRDFKDGLLDADSTNEHLRDDVIAIIVNRQNNSNISMLDIRNIYVDKMVNWADGGEITMYNLPLNSTGREIFSQNILDMTAIQAATEASNRVITNSAHNKSHTKEDRLVLSYVARNPRAIGYVPLKAAKSSSNVRIVMTME